MEDARRKILIVDDDLATRRFLSSILESECDIAQACSGEDAIEIALTFRPEIVLLDLIMPGVDGFIACRKLKEILAASPPQVIIVSARSSLQEQRRAFDCDADDYLVKPINTTELLSRVHLHLKLRESRSQTNRLQQQVNELHQHSLVQLQERSQQIVAIQDVAVFTLAKVAESRDNETGQHLIRLREYAQILATDLAHQALTSHPVDEGFLADLYRSSPLHDIGKVGIVDAILLKPGPLTADEFETMQRHTVIGANILRDALLQLHAGGFLAMAAQIAAAHHERWDGTGYPAGLAGEEIPLAARIVAVADVFDALTSHRPYKEAWSPEDARQAIVARSGTQFDQVIVAAFERCFVEFLGVWKSHAEILPSVVGAMAFKEHESLLYTH